MRDCFINDRRRYVAGTISDSSAVSCDETSPIYVKLLSTAARRDHDNDLHFRRDGAAVHPVFKSGTNHFDMGAEGRKTDAAAPLNRRGRGAARPLESAA